MSHDFCFYPYTWPALGWLALVVFVVGFCWVVGTWLGGRFVHLFPPPNS